MDIRGHGRPPWVPRPPRVAERARHSDSPDRRLALPALRSGPQRPLEKRAFSLYKPEPPYWDTETQNDESATQSRQLRACAENEACIVDLCDESFPQVEQLVGDAVALDPLRNTMTLGITYITTRGEDMPTPDLLICPQCGGYLAPSVDPKADQSGIECGATVQRERDAQSGTHAAPQESVESLDSGHRQTTSIYDRAPSTIVYNSHSKSRGRSAFSPLSAAKAWRLRHRIASGWFPYQGRGWRLRSITLAIRRPRAIARECRARGFPLPRHAACPLTHDLVAVPLSPALCSSSPRHTP